VTGPEGVAVKAENQARLKHRSVFDVNLTQPGTYRIALVNSGVFASWKDKATGQNKRARGTPETIAKEIPADAQELPVSQSRGRVQTFVPVGKPSPVNPVGEGLEMISTARPTDNVKGEKSTFTLLLDGQPAKDVEVTVTAGNTVYRDKLDELKVKTDAN